MERRRGPGLRARVTALATGLAALASGTLVILGWLLLGRVIAASPQFPVGSVVIVDGIAVDATVLSQTLEQQARQDMLIGGSIAFLLIVAATALLAWVITGRVLQPIHEVTEVARRLSAESLGERIRLSGPRDEVADLADTFDDMLDRLQAVFESQRRFVANASHELRTPLSVIRAELDVTTADPEASIADFRRMAEIARAATDRADALIAALLMLARTEGIGLSKRETVDLVPLVESAWQAVRAQSEDRNLHVSFHLAPVIVAGDPALLERIAGNLLENAVWHNVSEGWITVVLESTEQWAVLTVASSGEVVTVSMVEELFEPFRRGSTDRTAHSGTGLGLSIVRAAITAHRGHVRAQALQNGGLSVEVRLPRLLS